MRLIDADVLKRRAITVRFFGKDIMMVPTAEIDDAPTIDAVEVVRCRDCKYGEERIEDYKCGMLDEDWDIRFSPMHFCSYGERKGGDDE